MAATVPDKKLRICIACGETYLVTAQRHEPIELREVYCSDCRPKPPRVGPSIGDRGSDRKYHGGRFSTGEW